MIESDDEDWMPFCSFASCRSPMLRRRRPIVVLGLHAALHVIGDSQELRHKISELSAKIRRANRQGTSIVLSAL